MAKTWNGAQLRQARLHHGLTQEQLARAVSTTLRNIPRWEGSQNQPSAAMVQALAEFLGVDSASFFRNDDEAEDDDAEADMLAALDALLGRRIDALLRQRLAAHDTR
jgi:transcriptional regulator with XRE-family HTH domain